MVAIPTGVRSHLTAGFTCVSLTISDVESRVTFDIWIPSVEECLCLCPSYDGVLLMLTCVSSFIFWLLTTYWIYCLQISSLAE